MNKKQENIQILGLILIFIAISALVFTVITFSKSAKDISNNKYNFLNHNRYKTCYCDNMNGGDQDVFTLNIDNTDIINIDGGAVLDSKKY